MEDRRHRAGGGMEPGNGLAWYRPLWPGEEDWPGNTPGTGRPRTDMEGSSSSAARGRGAGRAPFPPARAMERHLAEPGPKTRTSHSMPGTSLQILVRETGLEPVWINRWILSPVRLPIPPLSQRLLFYHRHRFPASLGQPFPQYRTAGEAGAGNRNTEGRCPTSWRADGSAPCRCPSLPRQHIWGGRRAWGKGELGRG